MDARRRRGPPRVDTRIGLEDTLHEPDGTRTSGNAALVRAARALGARRSTAAAAVRGSSIAARTPGVRPVALRNATGLTPVLRQAASRAGANCAVMAVLEARVEHDAAPRRRPR